MSPRHNVDGPIISTNSGKQLHLKVTVRNEGPHTLAVSFDIEHVGRVSTSLNSALDVYLAHWMYLRDMYVMTCFSGKVDFAAPPHSNADSCCWPRCVIGHHIMEHAHRKKK